MKQEIIRKLSAAVAMSLVVGVSLAACGGSSSSTAAGVTKTGSAEGFGGAVTATLTVDANGTVTDCKLEGAQETESIGGAALEELSKQVVAANGPAIDGVAGATVTTKAVRKAVAAALGVELAEEAPADSAAAAPAEPAAIVPVEGGIQIGQAYAAAHGTKCFTEAVAVVKDDIFFIPHQSGAVHIHGRKFDSRSQLLYALFYNWKEVQDCPVLVWNFIAQHCKKQ